MSSLNIVASSVSGGVSFSTGSLPAKCPHCMHAVHPEYLFAYYNPGMAKLYVMFYCPRAVCRQMFAGQYHVWQTNMTLKLETVLLGQSVRREFSDMIAKISPGFIEIYHQAAASEHHRLDQISGIGYRKALEFLIKDYIIYKNPGDEELKEKVLKKLLMPCIKDHLPIEKVKDVAQRAVWIGNDETHYVRKWIDKDVDDLKKLIDLTVFWIEAEEATAEYIAAMPS